MKTLHCIKCDKELTFRGALEEPRHYCLNDDYREDPNVPRPLGVEKTPCPRYGLVTVASDLKEAESGTSNK